MTKNVMKAVSALMAPALLLGSLFAGCEEPAGSVSKVFRVATITWVGYGPIYLAKEKNFFDGIEVKIERIDDTAARRAAMASGEVQGSVDIVDSFVNAASSGLAASVVLKLDDSNGGDGIVVRRDVQDLRDLKGRTVAYPPGQPSHFFLLSLLADAGMSIDDVESRPMEADQAGAAFASGAVDAAVTWEPWLSRAVTMPDGKILTTSREKPGLIVDIFTVRNDFLSTQPDVVEAFIDGWLKAVELWQQKPDESNAVMARALGIGHEEFAQMVEGVVYADRQKNIEFFESINGRPSRFALLVAKANDVWGRSDVIKVPVAAETIDGSDLFLSTVP